MNIEELLESAPLKDAFLYKIAYRKILKGDPATRQQKIEALQTKLLKSVERCRQRAQNLPKIVYPDLPIVEMRQSILEALQTHQVIIVAGETGSGKTTQLPKICLEAGLGVRGMIGHTQPRRLAARTVATRIAQECEAILGEQVGYKVRFSDKSQPNSYIKVMTDGILLTETQNDKWLLQYDCLIIDEAHERSLNIDFLLGYLKNLLKKRSDLKVIVTSATIDVQRFSDFFDQAPLIQVSGRTYPVDVHYLEGSENDDPAANVAQAVDLAYQYGNGDLLIFQSGEKEIREVVEVLSKRALPNTEIIALYARQTVKEQQRAFQSSAKRKIIVATNVAETSITVPRIRFVIDSGFARISRYNYKSKLQRLPIEPISQASAEQRKGRCGRIGPGICFRLYSKEDFLTRSEYTEPEILRTNLAGVILKMLHLNLKDIEAFPFIDPPDSRYIKDAFALLERLEAVNNEQTITPIGRLLAQIPIEPKLGRAIIAADHYGVLKEILVIISALTIQDPRERPQDQQQKADEKHAQFKDDKSDFMSFLKLWDFIHAHKKTLSHQQFRHLCRENMLSYIRVCEWFDVHEQLTEIAIELGFKLNQVSGDFVQIHKALLTGLIDSIGQKQENKEYLGARNTRFFIHPGSGLFKKTPTWVFACEIVHTTKVFARTNAAIDPKWIEEVAKHLLKRQYFSPYYDAKEGRVLAFEKVSLFGLEIIPKRRISYEKIAPVEARQFFIQHALVEEELEPFFAFYEKNNKTLASLRDLENKSRQHRFIDESLIFQFYDKHLPISVYSIKTLAEYLKNESNSSLIFTPQEVSSIEIDQDFYGLFPDQLEIQGQLFSLEYRFDLSATDDGVTLIVPLEALKILKEEDFSRLVPGLIEAKIAAAFKALPKKIRMNLGSLPAHVSQAADYLKQHSGNFFQVLTLYLKSVLGLPLEHAMWIGVTLDNYLNMHFKVINAQKQLIAQGDDLSAIYHSLKEDYAENFVEKHPIEKKIVTKWDFGSLEKPVSIQKGNLRFDYYPALTEKNGVVQVQLFETRALAEQHHPAGLAQLYILQLENAIKSVKRNILPPQKKQLTKVYAEFGTFDQLVQDVVFNVAFHLFVSDSKEIKTAEQFEKNFEVHRTSFILTANELIRLVSEILILHTQVMNQLQHAKEKWEHSFDFAINDLLQQMEFLFKPHFIKETPLTWLKRYPVYLAAILQRIEKLPRQLERDKQLWRDIDELQKAYKNKISAPGVALNWDNTLNLFIWKIEELRVSLFAQSLGTLEPVSKTRLLKVLENLR